MNGWILEISIHHHIVNYMKKKFKEPPIWLGYHFIPLEPVYFKRAKEKNYFLHPEL